MMATVIGTAKSARFSRIFLPNIFPDFSFRKWIAIQNVQNWMMRDRKAMLGSDLTIGTDATVVTVVTVGTVVVKLPSVSH
jgi:hypothetical protein